MNKRRRQTKKPNLSEAMKELQVGAKRGVFAAPSVHNFRSFEVAGFKAFGSNQEIPIRPLTIVFGANSAGKSSLLHSLLYLHEMARSHNLDVRKPDIARGMIDLGGLSQFVNSAYSHDAMVFEFHFGGPSPLPILEFWGEEISSRDYRFDLFQFDPIRSLAHPVTNRDFGINGTCMIESILGFDDESPRTLNDGYHERKTLAGWERILVQCGALNHRTSPEIDADREDQILELVNAVDEALEWQLQNGLTAWCDAGMVNADAPLKKPLNQIADGLSAFTYLIAEEVNSLIESMEYFGPFRDYRSRESLIFDPIMGANLDKTFRSEDPWETLFVRSDVRARVNCWFRSCPSFDTPYEITRNRFLTLDGFLDVFNAALAPEQDANSMDSELGQSRHYLLDEANEHELFSEPEMVDIARKIQLFLDGLHHAYPGAIPAPSEERAKEIAIHLTDSNFKNGLERLVLVDRKNGKEVSLPDIGVGLSQLLPLVVGAFAGENRLFLMEQPELHVHPSLQAELADVFIESALGEGKNGFILETHSEHLLLRVLRRIRETTNGKLPEGHLPIGPDDVSVLYIQKGDKGAEVIPIPLTEDGDFGVPWPKGFFPERSVELF